MAIPLNDPVYTVNMTTQQRAWFYAEYERARKDEVVGVLLAIFLGGLGIHHFYLRRNGLGALYLIFSWTGLPTILGWIDAFFTPGRVRQYNATQAMYISSQILGSAAHFGSPPPPLSSHCNACGGPINSTATFCHHCGAALGSPLSNQPAV